MTHTGLRNVLIVICLVLAAGLLLWTQTGPGPILALANEAKIQTADKQPLETTELDNTISATGIPIESYQELEKRPLFTPDRRPPAPDILKAMEIPKTRKVESKQTTMVLVGILQDGESLRAYIKNDRAAPPLALGTGEQIDGWMLKEIAEGQVTLVRGGKERQLQLDWKGSGTIRRAPPKRRRAVHSAARPKRKQNKAAPVIKRPREPAS